MIINLNYNSENNQKSFLFEVNLLFVVLLIYRLHKNKGEFLYRISLQVLCFYIRYIRSVFI